MLPPSGKPPPHPSQETKHPNSLNKPVIVGFYGASSTGKSFLMKHLERKLGQDLWRFYDGLVMIEKYSPGGLKGFNDMERGAQYYYRGEAMKAVQKEGRDTGKATVVAGHLMFWEEDRSEEEGPDEVYTKMDLAVYTHMIYLWNDPEVIIERRKRDTTKRRRDISASRLLQWQKAEVSKLGQLCLENGILFSTIGPGYEQPDLQQEISPFGKAVKLLRDFHCHTEKHNSQKAGEDLKKSLNNSRSNATFLTLDADKKLVPEATGEIFWIYLTSENGIILTGKPWLTLDIPFNELFNALGYSYTAFRQLALLSKDLGSAQLYGEICQNIADHITMHPKILTLLHLTARDKMVGVVVNTNGTTRVWDSVSGSRGCLSKCQNCGWKLSCGWLCCHRRNQGRLGYLFAKY